MIGGAIAVLGIVGIVIGLLFLAASVLPTFGGNRAGNTEFTLGAVFFIGGIIVVFYGGTWI